MPDGPLHGLRVVELSSFVASPLGGMTLARLGADVVRVDPPAGGPDRDRWPLSAEGRSLYWAGLNKGKRSVTVDLRSPEGRELVAGLIESGGDRGGIVLTNTRLRDGLTYEDLSARRPDLIHLRLLGRRDGGAAVDYTVNAAYGFPWLTGPEESTGPVNHVLPVWDVVAGMYLAVGLLAAERARARTGQGQRLEIALEDVALATAGDLGFLAEAQLNPAPRQRTGNDFYGDFGRDFATGDGRRLMVLCLTARHWNDLMEATGLGETVDALAKAFRADFAAAADRFRYRDALAGVLTPWFASRTVPEIDSALQGRTVLWSLYRSMAELAADDGRVLGEAPLMDRLDQPGIGPHLAPGSPLVFDGRQSPPEPSPELGEHTADVLGEVLGMGASRLAALRERGVVGGAA